jgi:hypothetical protein
MQRPPRPAVPPADEKVGLRYSRGSASAEVVGVCKITESEIRCWDASGRSAPALKAMVEQSLDRRSSYSPISFVYGKKNRIVIFKMTNVFRPGSPSDYLMVQSAGDPSGQNFGPYLQIEVPRKPDQPYTPSNDRYEARGLAVDRSARTGTARLQCVQSLPEVANLAVKAGTKAKANGISMELVSIKKAGKDSAQPMYVPGGATQEAWEVVLKMSPSQPALTCTPTLMLADGKPAMYLDSSGKPISQPPPQSFTQPSPGRPFGSSMQSIMVYQTAHAGSQYTFRMNVDPKGAKLLALRFSKSRVIEMSGIPLDPK